jgi:hypothetical protein
MKKLLTSMALTIFATTANAAINTIVIEELMQKPLQLSEKQINRISVKDGIVSSIIANPSKFNIQIDETLGQAFVTLFEPIEDPEGFTVVTDSGYTQDFLVTSALGEPIITYLTEPVEEEELFRQVLDFRGFYDIYHGRSLEGFIKRILHRDESLEVGELLPYIQDVTVYSGDFEDIYVITLRNHSRRRVPVDFSEFNDLSWFFSPVAELKPKETSKIIISKARH